MPRICHFWRLNAMFSFLVMVKSKYKGFAFALDVPITGRGLKCDLGKINTRPMP